jgi:hypothetical protein
MSRVLPVLFNTEMVRATLEGRRSCISLKIPIDIVNNCDVETDGTLLSYENNYGDFIKPVKLCQYQPGDILYVRETWKKAPNGYYYYEDWQRNDIADITKWKPSIHMPKEAARIWLKVTDVRVERLQEITEEQAKLEGCNSGMLTGPCTARGQFENLWNSTIKKSDLDLYGWDANPRVWVIEFDRCEKPEVN